MKAIIGCEYSGKVRDALIRHGHEAISCDLEASDTPGPHYQGSIFDLLDYPFDFGGFHFPCTHASVSGARHFAAKKMDGRYYAGVALWMQGWRRSRHIPRGYFEHPVSVMSSEFRKADQTVQPWMFGDFETKATCFWTWGLPPLVPTYKTIDACREALCLPRGAMPADRIHKMPPSEERAKLRSQTYPGIAEAIASQWGGF